MALVGKKGNPIKPSTSSKMIQCEYNVMVEMDIPWAPDLEIYIPTVIYAPQSAYVCFFKNYYLFFINFLFFICLFLKKVL